MLCPHAVAYMSVVASPLAYRYQSYQSILPLTVHRAIYCLIYTNVWFHNLYHHHILTLQLCSLGVNHVFVLSLHSVLIGPCSVHYITCLSDIYVLFQCQSCTVILITTPTTYTITYATAPTASAVTIAATKTVFCHH